MNTIRKNLLVDGVTPPTFNNTTQALDALDITMHKSLFVEVKVVGASAAGTVKLQWSVAGLVWEDIPSGLGVVTVTFTAGGTKFLYINNCPATKVRCFATSSDTNAWVITGNMIAKEF